MGESRRRRQESPGNDHRCGFEKAWVGLASSRERIMARRLPTPPRFYLEGPYADGLSIVDRAESGSCGSADCPRGGVWLVPHEDRPHALAAGARKWQVDGGERVRNFAVVVDVGATWVDATAEFGIDERSIRGNVPYALALLYDVRDHGADVIVVRSQRPGERIAFAYRDTFGDALEVEWEGAAIYDHRGWHGLPDEWSTASATGRTGVADHVTPSRRVTFSGAFAFAIWETVLAVVAVLATGPLLELLGWTATIQVVPIVIVSLLVGWLSGTRLLCLLKAVAGDWLRRQLLGDFIQRLENLERRAAEAVRPKTQMLG